MFINGKATYYPLKDIVGSEFCYIRYYLVLWFCMYAQFSSLFITFYRYICIFFGKQLVQLKISPKVKNGQIRDKILFCTGKSLSEALLFAIHGESMLCTKIVLNVRNNFCTQHVLPRFELGIFMY